MSDLEYKKLSNHCTALLNFLNKKLHLGKIESAVYKLKLFTNNCELSELKVLSDQIVIFASKNVANIKNRNIDDLDGHLEIMEYIKEYKTQFSEEEINEIWKRVDNIIAISVKISKN